MKEIRSEKKYVDVMPVLLWLDDVIKQDEMQPEARAAYSIVAQKLIGSKSNAKEIVKASWKEKRVGDLKLIYCSNCRTVGSPTAYCPACGAEMHSTRGGR